MTGKTDVINDRNEETASGLNSSEMQRALPGAKRTGKTTRHFGLFLVCTAAILAFAGCATVVHTPAPAPDEVRIIASEHSSDGHRQAEINGSVQNFTSSTVYNIIVSGEISGPQGRVWGQGSDRIARLNPNETKRFKIKINDVPPGQIQNHRVWLEIAGPDQNQQSERQNWHDRHDDDSGQDKQ